MGPSFAIWALLRVAWGAEQQLHIEVAVPGNVDLVDLRVQMLWLGELKDEPLTTELGTPVDQPNHGVWSATLRGEPLRLATVGLLCEWEGETLTLWEGSVAPFAPEDTLSFRLEPGPPPRAVRIAALPSAGPRERAGELGLAAGLGWAGLVFLYVAWLVGRALPPDPA